MNYTRTAAALAALATLTACTGSSNAAHDAQQACATINHVQADTSKRNYWQDVAAALDPAADQAARAAISDPAWNELAVAASNLQASPRASVRSKQPAPSP